MMKPHPAFDAAIDKLTRKGYRVTRNSPDSTGQTCYLVKRKGCTSFMAQVEWIEESKQVFTHCVE